MTSPNWNQRRDFAQAVLLANDTVVNGAVFPFWIDDGHFWYERKGDAGAEYCVVDASSGNQTIVVTRAAVADALSAHLDTTVDTANLLMQNPRFDLSAQRLSFDAFGSPYSYDFGADPAVLAPAEKAVDLNWLVSPDGRRALFARDGNLWLRDVDAGSEKPLTQGGTEFNAYGVTPAAMRGFSAASGIGAPEASWSPDGAWVLTIQTDDRHVPDLPIIDYAPVGSLRPAVKANKVSLPGDPQVTEFRFVAIEIDTGREVEARYPRLNAVRMNSTPFGAGLVWWSADGRIAYFVDIERGEQRAHVVAFDVISGATRTIFSEESESYVELSVNVYTPALIRPLPVTDELVWYSERTGRGHLYLYNLATGTGKNAITAGEWQVREILRVDPDRREVFFLAGGISKGEDPYVIKPCVASLDGGEVKVLSDAPGDHIVWHGGEMGLMLKKLEGLDPRQIQGLSPGGDYFVETVSSSADLPVTFLRNRHGTEILTLERATGAPPEGWQAPEPVSCMAADNTTRTYGLLFKPFGHEPGGRYPLIDLIYGGPQVSHVPHGSFADGSLGAHAFVEAMHLSALGAFVLILDGRGTANREQAFRTASYRAAHTASNLEDHVSAIRQLADRRNDIELDRVGITGFSGGGYMTAHAALRFGDFFKVAVAGGGNYDQALFWHSWGERYHGEYDPEHYAVQAAKTYAKGMVGKLMLVHGLQDSGCHPAALFQLVQALVDANKDPELVLLPRIGHDWTGYGLRRRWEYLATHLIGQTPPVFAPFERDLDKILSRVASNAKAPEQRA